MKHAEAMADMLTQEMAKKVPREFELVSQKKGFKRFMSPQLRSLLRQRADALEAKEVAMANILQVLHWLA